MQQPQVVVNPFSMLTPGIFRSITEMTGCDPSVIHVKLQSRRVRRRCAHSDLRAREGSPGPRAAGQGPRRAARGDRRLVVGVFHTAAGAQEKVRPRVIAAAVAQDVQSTGRISTCFFLPRLSLMTRSPMRSTGVSIAFSSVIAASLTRSRRPGSAAALRCWIYEPGQHERIKHTEARF